MKLNENLKLRIENLSTELIQNLLRSKPSLKNSNTNKGAGFTLVELLLYMGIFTIFLAITLQLFGSIFDVQLESEAVSSVSSDGKYIIERFSYDVNQATSVSDPISFGSSNPTLSFVSNGQNLTYSLSNGDLILANSTEGTMDQLNSHETSVTDLSFVRLDGAGKDALQITFTLTSDAVKKGGAEVTTFQTSAGLR